MTLSDARIQYDLCVAVAAQLPELDEHALIILRNARTSLEWAERDEMPKRSRRRPPVTQADADPEAEDDDSLSVKQAAKALGCSPQLVYKLKDRGELSGHYASGKVVVTKDSVEAHKAKRRFGKKEPAPSTRKRKAGREVPGFKYLKL